MPKPDAAHLQTDKELAKLEKRIAKIYKEAADDLQSTIDDYFAKFAKRDEKQKARLDAGEITEQEYKQWRLAQMGRGERFKALQSRVAERYTEANETAVRYVNDATPGIYSLNRNYSAYTIEKVAGNVGFDLWDEQTVKRLIVDNPEVMPYYPPEKALKRGIDLAYGKKQISASVTSSILQGKSIPNIAKDLRTRIPDMNKASAIRTARTAVTGAQNAGRMDSYVAAEKMGIKLKREWVAVIDKRTRHAHAMLDGQKAEMGKPFKVDGEEIMFPGDTSAPGYLVYNCRCSLVADVDGVDTSDAQRRVRDPVTGKNIVVSDMTYQEWAGWKKNAPVKKAMGKEWSTEEEYREAKQKAKSVFEEYDRTFEERYQEERRKIEDSYGGNFMLQRINIRNNQNLTDEQKEIELEKLKKKREKMNVDIEALSERFDKEREEAYERMTGTYDLDYEFKKITGKHSVRFDSESVNPNFSTFQFEYTNNCQRCSVAYELRQRGYDVEAMPAYNGGVGAGAQIKSIFPTAQEFSTDSYGHDATVEIIKQMEEWGSGSRGILAINRADGSGHAYNMQNVNGVVSFVDPQCGSVWDVSEFGYDTDGGAIENSFSSWLIRTDNAKVHQIPDDYVRDK